jgi:uncharacterized protein YbbK (DUF523 family)
MEQILVSACLLGLRTRYDGKDAHDPRLKQFSEQFIFIPVCPEVLGGLDIPREPATIEDGGGALFWERGGRIVREDGTDVSGSFRIGAERTVAFAKLLGISRIILKEGSPSCGVTETNVLFNCVKGIGIAAFLLKEHGITVDSVDSFLSSIHLLR